MLERLSIGPVLGQRLRRVEISLHPPGTFFVPDGFSEAMPVESLSSAMEGSSNLALFGLEVSFF